MGFETYANQPATTVSSGGTAAPLPGTVQTWTVASSGSFPAAATGVTQFHVADVATGFQSELIAVTNVSGTTWTVTRGAESTTPVAHTAGFTITQVVPAGALANVPPVFSVIKYGADPTGTNDSSVAINNAVTDAAVNGGVVYLPPGTYHLGSGPLFNASAAINNVTLAGAGRGATTLTANGSLTGGTADLIRIAIPTASAYGDTITIRDMTLDCSNQTAGNGITCQGVNNLTLYNLKILNPFGFGIDWGTSGGNTPYAQNLAADLILIQGERNGNDSIGGGGIINGSVTRYTCTDSGTHQVAGTASNLTNITNFSYRGCYASTSNASTTTGAFNTDFGATDVTWEDIYVSGFKYGVVVSSNSSGQAQDITIRGLKVATVHANAIYFNTAAGFGVHRFSIVESQVDAWDTAGAANAAFQIFGGNKGYIGACQFASGVTTAYAIRLAGDNGSTSLNPPTYVTLIGNDVSACTFGIFPQFVDPTCLLDRNRGYNPTGTQSVAVPGTTGTAVAATYFDRTFYVTAAATGTTTMAIQGGPTISIPVSMVVPVRVPAGQTVTPNWSVTAPTWVVEGE